MEGHYRGRMDMMCKPDGLEGSGAGIQGMVYWVCQRFASF